MEQLTKYRTGSWPSLNCNSCKEEFCGTYLKPQSVYAVTLDGTLPMNIKMCYMHWIEHRKPRVKMIVDNLPKYKIKVRQLPKQSLP